MNITLVSWEETGRWVITLWGTPKRQRYDAALSSLQRELEILTWQLTEIKLVSDEVINWQIKSIETENIKIKAI